MDQDFNLCDAVNISGKTDNFKCEIKRIYSYFPYYIFFKFFNYYPAPVRVGRLREKRVIITHYKSKLHY